MIKIISKFKDINFKVKTIPNTKNKGNNTRKINPR